MKLPGRLRLTTLGDVLGALHREAACGTLELTEDRGAIHRVHLDAGRVFEVESELSRSRLGELLAGQGFLGALGLARLAQRLLEAPPQRTGDILIEEGLATAELVSAGLRRQLRLKLEALFNLTDARLTFRVPRARAGKRQPLSPGEFLHGRPRARFRVKPGTGAAPAFAVERGGARLRAFATLGLLPGADLATVQQAFRRLARSQHPDRFPEASASERARHLEKFAQLSAAYHALAG